jgi:type I restriction enzyme S subunit
MTTISMQQIVKIHYGKSLKEEERDHTGKYSVFGSSGEVGKHNSALITYPTLIIGRKGSVGNVTLAPSGGWPIDTTFYVEIVRSNDVDLKYLYYALKNSNLERHTITTSIPGLNRDDIYKTRIPFPKLALQQRIAAILDKADAIRELRRQAIAKHETLLKAVFQEMFGDPATNLKRWSCGKISNLCEDIIDCPHSTPKYAATVTPYACWRSSDIQNGYIDKTATKYVYLEEYNQRIQRTPPKKGDVIYCREGARFGNAARILDDEKSCLGQRMMLLRAAPGKGTPEYIWAFLNAKSTYQKIVGLVGGSASPHVNVKEIKAFAAPIPPFHLQEKFSMLVHRIDQMRERSYESADMLDRLFNSLQQRAFAGKLFTEKAAAAAQQELFAD